MRWMSPLLLFVTACASTPKDASWLFVQNAGRAELTDTTLTLYDAAPAVVCFTDRPQRRAGTVPVLEFLRGWSPDGVFADDPPNATLAVFTPDGVRETVVVLTGAHEERRALVYEVRILEGEPGAVGPAALFIDSVGSGAPVIRHGMHDEPGVVIRRGMHPAR